MEPITVSYQVISSNYTRWDKVKRFGRSLAAKAKNFLAAAKEKITDCKHAIAKLFRNLSQQCNRCYCQTWETVSNIKNDWDNDMELLTKIGNFLFGPQGDLETSTNYPTEFSTGNVAGQMISAVISQRGYVSEEQTTQFIEIAKNAEANAKRVKVALEAIKKVSGAETEVTKEVYKVLSALEKDAFKRSEYQYNRRREHRIMEEKYNNLRRGL